MVAEISLSGQRGSDHPNIIDPSLASFRVKVGSRMTFSRLDAKDCRDLSVPGGYAHDPERCIKPTHCIVTHAASIVFPIERLRIRGPSGARVLCIRAVGVSVSAAYSFAVPIKDKP